MKSYTTRQTKARLAEVVKRAREEPVAVTRFGRVSAVVISPDQFREYEAFKRFLNSELVIAGVHKALENFSAGDSARGHGALRAIAPYWRKARIKSAPRLKTSPRRV